MEQIILLVAQIYKLLIIVAVVLSWIRVDPYHPAVQFVNRLTEPVFARIRQYVPTFHGIDLSPLVAFVLVYVLEHLLIWVI